MCWAHAIVVRVISQDCFILDLTTPSLVTESPSHVFCVPLEDLIIIVFVPFFNGVYYGTNCMLQTQYVEIPNLNASKCEFN